MAKEPKAKEHSKKSKAKEYTKTCLEDSTERSESNPGRSLGIITEEKRAVWKTVPDNMLLRLRLCPHVLKKFTDNTDATDFIFSRILFLLVLPVDIGFTTDCFCAYTALDYLQQEIIRERTNPLYSFNPCSFHH